MKGKLLKFVPIVVGLMLGWLLTSPPAWLEFLGPARYLVMGVLVFVLLVAFTAVMISSNLPGDVPLTPAPELAVPQDLGALADRFQALGFHQAGPMLRVGLNPPAILMPFVHEAERTYATIFRTGTIPAKTAFEMVSLLEGGRGGLSTAAEPTAGYLPASPGSFKQIFPRMELELLFDRHREAIALLKARGLGAKAAAAGSFVQEFKSSLARQRRAFLSAPLRATLVMLSRSISGKSPHLGPLRAQPATEGQVRAALRGGRG